MGRPPWLLPFVVIFLVLPTAIGLWIALVPILKAHRMRRAGRSGPPSDSCAACGAVEVETIAPLVLRCTQCGFTGGEGMAAWQRRVRLQRIDRMSREERYASATSDLREARLTLMSAQALLNDAIASSAWDIADLALDRGRAKQSSYGAAARHMRTALELAKGALQTLKNGEERELVDFDERSFLLDIDAAWLSDGLITDIAMHGRIEQARQHANHMLERVEKMLRDMTSPR